MFDNGTKRYVASYVDKQRMMISKYLTDGIKSGAVQPLNRNVFSKDEIEQAFRFMASGKHIGKVVVKIRDNEDSDVFIKAIPRTVFYAHKCKSYFSIFGDFKLTNLLFCG